MKEGGKCGSIGYLKQSMIISGNKISEDMRIALKERVSSLCADNKCGEISLGIVLVGDNAVSKKYIKKKKAFGESLGVKVNLFVFEPTIEENKLEEEVMKISSTHSGVVVQLPLPKNLNIQKILDAVPRQKDVDVLATTSYELFSRGEWFLPPVVRAIKEILNRSGVSDFEGMSALVLGQGRLVGKPITAWLKHEGANVMTAKKDTQDIATLSRGADLIITGVGVPGVLKLEMLPGVDDANGGKGVIIVDAGTSEASGKLMGDADPACAEKSYIFTPVPGGVGPVTVAALFSNLVDLWSRDNL
ncbi:MAG TPA: bifunctional 5,10-methylenetetrahydrofolate dehydrogenase/5,10-methenyltetrahydrofolate cyclohydrolase [Candidatus Paceibacterota bacterium]|nr:bifunctional 5,10-methylenetetrahydrofolate dehydrogenase/5,10-methenyltetrahydrofolate cyclohydrolase [Candidatus Paceibacterota bacterium]